MLEYSQQVPVGLTDVGVLRLVMDGVAKDVEGREWKVLAVGSAVLIPWFVVELSPSPGGIMALLLLTGGEGLPGADEVAVTSSVGWPRVRAVEAT